MNHHLTIDRYFSNQTHCHDLLQKLESVRGDALRRAHGVEQVRRIDAHIQREYNVETYGALLDSGLTNRDALYALQMAAFFGQDALPVSHRNKLYLCDPRTACEAYHTFIVTAIESYRGQGNVCELGCGWGYNISYFDGAVGGELTENGIKLGRKLGYNILPFNFYNPSDYEIVPWDSVVFTCCSVEQLPSAGPVFEGLARIKDRIRCVIHFEPSAEALSPDPFRQMRRKYVESNDYNCDLETLIASRDDVRVLDVARDVIGLNPLFPTNFYVWQFV